MLKSKESQASKDRNASQAQIRESIQDFTIKNSLNSQCQNKNVPLAKVFSHVLWDSLFKILKENSLNNISIPCWLCKRTCPISLIREVYQRSKKNSQKREILIICPKRSALTLSACFDGIWRKIPLQHLRLSYRLEFRLHPGLFGTISDRPTVEKLERRSNKILTTQWIIFWLAYKNAIKWEEKVEESRRIFVLNIWLDISARKFKLESFWFSTKKY